MKTMTTIERQFLGAKAGDVVLHAHYCLRAGDFDQALTICRFARSAGIDETSILLMEASAQFASGESDCALDSVDSLLRAVPDNVSALFLKAIILMRLGDLGTSCSLVHRVIEQFPDFPGALYTLSSLLMPGRPYRDVLAWLHQVLRPNTYLEIGIGRGATLGLATTARRIVGLDPIDHSIDYPVPSKARVYHMTSDEFFAGERPENVFSGEPVDLIFIDGMHWFEYALRDFINVERWASKGSTIVIHDCLPVSRFAATRDRQTRFWVGDVWKALEAIIEYRPDLDIGVVPTPPSGLVIIRQLNPSSVVLQERFEEIIARYSSLEYPYDFGVFPAHYRLIQNDENSLTKAFTVSSNVAQNR
jgi:hypothetical protein